MPVALLMLHQPETVFVLLQSVSNGFRCRVGSETKGEKLVALLCRNTQEARVPATAAAQTAALFAHMRHFGQPWCVFGSWGSEPLKAAVFVAQHTRQSPGSVIQRKMSLRCGKRSGSCFRAGEAVSGERVQGNWWLVGGCILTLL